MAEERVLSTEPYKGVRDFYPEDMALQSHIFSAWSTIAESFGFERYDASVLEPAELYRSKTSEEIVNEQTYTFADRGEREVTLRPEMTPTAARMIANRRRELSFPARWYSIPNLFRYERTQRGRLREHWQLNCDIFGTHDPAADAEIILLAHTLLTSCGATERDFEIRINDRTLLEKAVREKLVSEDLLPHYFRLLDKKSKMAPGAFEAEEKKLLREPVVFNRNECAGLDTLIKTLEGLGVTNIVFDPTIVRGFDYYTGTVFEVFDTHEDNRRSILGGGRYDNLTGLFGGDPVPGVGFGLGDVTFRDFLETHNLLPQNLAVPADVSLILPNGTRSSEAQHFAQTLRARGIRTSVDLSGKKLGDQIARADKRKIPYIVTIGDDELQSGIFVLKRLATGAETRGTIDELARHITGT